MLFRALKYDAVCQDIDEVVMQCLAVSCSELNVKVSKRFGTNGPYQRVRRIVNTYARRRYSTYGSWETAIITYSPIVFPFGSLDSDPQKVGVTAKIAKNSSTSIN